MKEKKKTARTALWDRLYYTTALAVHELNITGHSQNALATELSFMAKDGLVVGTYRKGERFKEWVKTETAQVVA